MRTPYNLAGNSGTGDLANSFEYPMLLLLSMLVWLVQRRHYPLLAAADLFQAAARSEP